MFKYGHWSKLYVGSNTISFQTVKYAGRKLKVNCNNQPAHCYCIHTCICSYCVLQNLIYKSDKRII